MIFRFKRGNFAIKLEAQGFKNNELEKVKDAAKHVVYALSSHEFKEFCLNYSYKIKVRASNYRWWRRRYVWKNVFDFWYNKNESRQHIYKKIISGSETLNPEVDNEADIYLKIDRRNKRGVLGYTYPNSRWQWIYNWFFRQGDVESIAVNIAHEYAHKAGYGHEYKNTTRRKYSVPYAIGYFVRDFTRAKK